MTAVAAGDVPDRIRVPLLALLGDDISVGGSYIASDGSHAGSIEDHVDVLVCLGANVTGPSSRLLRRRSC
ncbi:hypothetical protein [Arthrobacter sp. efr-133-TYG-118]|uniref:hypothetical protein n=1 Tax=Arthrobacter sp. efr-133-TYG-118 TaxID=3040279 RepID=UPI00254ADD42|nr:hypothetical protein [Arthrobacter sp. efr-133-TYG-118]